MSGTFDTGRSMMTSDMLIQPDHKLALIMTVSTVTGVQVRKIEADIFDNKIYLWFSC